MTFAVLSGPTGNGQHADVSFHPLAPGVAVVDTTPSGPASLLDVSGKTTLRPRQLQTVLRDLCCRQGLAGLRTGGAMDGRDVLTVVAGGGDQRFIETTLAVARHLGLTIEIVALVSAPPTADGVESMGAVSLARRFRDMGGVQPEWDVLHGPTPDRALAAYVHRTRPKLVALPHPHHRATTRCHALRAARHLDTAVLIA